MCFNGKLVLGLGVKFVSGVNVFDIVDGVKVVFVEFEFFFFEGLIMVVFYDMMLFVLFLIEKVVSILIEVVVLVFLVMYLFL